MALVLVAPVAAKKGDKKPTDPEELFNPILGIEHSYWLVGPIVHIATPEEVEEYLLLASDEEAERFIEAFWERRNADTPVFEETPQDIFEKRAAEADKRFTEGAYPGQRTDRGTVFILHGEPEDISYEVPRKVNDPPLEAWRYTKDAPPGLSGEPPRRLYRFIEIGDRTVFFTGQDSRRNARDRFHDRTRDRTRDRY